MYWSFVVEIVHILIYFCESALKKKKFLQIFFNGKTQRISVRAVFSLFLRLIPRASVPALNESSTLKLFFTMAAFDFAQLQNKIKRDPDSYKDEFLLQKRHFQTQLQIFQIKPQTLSGDFELQINFLSHVRFLFVTLFLLKIISIIVYRRLKYTLRKCVIFRDSSSIFSNCTLPQLLLTCEQLYARR